MVVHRALRGLNTNTNQIEKVTIRNSLDIENYRRPIDPQLDLADHVRLTLSNRESLQRVVIFLGPRCKSLWATAGTERVGKLMDCENPFPIQTCSFSFLQIGKQTKVVLFSCVPFTAIPILAFGTMAIQDEFGRRGIGMQFRDFLYR